MSDRFEKSLYDLIRGIRKNQGSEREYIQHSLKECRAEVRSQDMDVKATALLKLVYLEMMGHDMSWASFHVLEVMSSAKQQQKRLGYLAAVQSFRPDTEVLMLATNLIKKDLNATSIPTISLPITSLPHVITPSLALSTLSDLLPRLSHSSPYIRKKTVVSLYRLALVYPETLRAAWPKIKDRLMADKEDPSVTAAIINVVCELGARRPHDFLPLAPRLFDLLVESGNNWMAIKLIKLFASLTPLEPRLIRKLLPPLTDLIRTTPAMSLLYECINGIIQGGILGGAEDINGREEIAVLCVSKLRSMIMVDGDPNLKYVALLAFNKIVMTHPFLVSQQEDVILDCIDSPDITIRVQSLNLVTGMVSSENLVSVVSRLMRQLKLATSDLSADKQTGADVDADAEAEFNVHAAPKSKNQRPPLPEDYRIDVVNRILQMCSQNNYSNLTDFEWYIDILTQLVRTAPTPSTRDAGPSVEPSGSADGDVSEKIGNELRNIAVKVAAVRSTAVNAAELILSRSSAETTSNSAPASAVGPIAWMVGEYSNLLTSSQDSLQHLLQILPRIRNPLVLVVSLQAVIKLFSKVTDDNIAVWGSERKAMTSLLLARVLHVIEPLTQHPSLEVQERAVQFTELLKLTGEAIASQPASTDEVQQDAPLLLTQAIPSLFNSWELNSVAPGAQHNVPLPDGLDLDEPINPNLNSLLAASDDHDIDSGIVDDEFDTYYNQRPAATSIASNEPAINRLQDASEDAPSSYQAEEDSYLDPDILARRKAERDERNRDDPFYIGNMAGGRGTSTPIHAILEKENGTVLDVDSIPIMQLDLSKLEDASHQVESAAPRPKPRPRQNIVIAADENLSGSGISTPRSFEGDSRSRQSKQQSLLQVDSSHLKTLSLTDKDPQTTSKRANGARAAATAQDYEQRKREDDDMAKAMKEVERLRLEMQRAKERIQVAQGVDAEGTMVVTKKKKKKKPKTTAEDENGEPAVADDGVVVKPKKKRRPKPVAPVEEATAAEAS